MKRLLMGLAALVMFAVSPALALGPPPIVLYGIQLDTGTKTVAAVAGAATLNKAAGVVTSEALTTAAAATYTLTLTNSTIAATDQVLVSIGNGTNSAGSPELLTVTPGAGSVVIVIRNGHATVAFNGTLKVAFAKFTN